MDKDVPEHVVSGMRQWLFQLLSSLLYKGCSGSQREFCNQVGLQLKNFTLAQVLHHIDLIRDRFHLDLRAELEPASLSAEQLLFEFYNALLMTEGAGVLLHGYVCNANQQSNLLVVRDALEKTGATWVRKSSSHRIRQDPSISATRVAARSASAARSSSSVGAMHSASAARGSSSVNARRSASAARSSSSVGAMRSASASRDRVANSVSGSRNSLRDGGNSAQKSFASANAGVSRGSALSAQSIQANTFLFNRQPDSVSVAGLPRKPSSGASRTFAAGTARFNEADDDSDSESSKSSNSSDGDSFGVNANAINGNVPNRNFGGVKTDSNSDSDSDSGSGDSDSGSGDSDSGSGDGDSDGDGDGDGDNDNNKNNNVAAYIRASESDSD
jgi:hypothetical protein